MIRLVTDIANKSLLILSCSYAAILGALCLFQRKLQYFPTAEVPTLDSLPTAFRRVEEFEVHVIDGLKLKGWLWRQKSSPVLILHLHGNAGNRFHRLYWANEIVKRTSCSVALFDYRGFGGNPGRISEDGLIKDAVAAITWAYTNAKRNSQKLVLHLESIGSAVGLSALLKMAVEVRVDGIVVEGGLCSCYDLARSMLPFVPVKLLLRDKWNLTIQGAQELDEDINFLSLHGKADRIVPLWCGTKLFEAVSCRHKKFIAFEFGDHNDLIIQPGYLDELLEFYAEVERKDT